MAVFVLDRRGTPPQHRDASSRALPPRPEGRGFTRKLMTKPVDVEIWLEDRWLAEKGVGYPNVSVEQKEENVNDRND